MSIVRRLEEQAVAERVEPFGHPGTMIARSLINGNEDLWNKGRLLGVNTLPKGCGVGWHVHEGDGEMYYIIQGEAEYNDNGNIVTLKPGDVTFTSSGEGHAMTNHNDEPVVFMALILFE